MDTRLVDLTPHVRGHGVIRGRAAFAVAGPCGAPASAGLAHVAGRPAPGAPGDLHPEALGSLRRLAVHLETAALLERRADRSTDPSLAAAHRARAEAHRRIADQLREHLAGKGLPRTSGPPEADRPHP